MGGIVGALVTVRGMCEAMRERPVDLHPRLRGWIGRLGRFGEIVADAALGAEVVGDEGGQEADEKDDLCGGVPSFRAWWRFQLRTWAKKAAAAAGRAAMRPATMELTKRRPISAGDLSGFQRMVSVIVRRR